jgi:stage II sporulation protein E
MDKKSNPSKELKLLMVIVKHALLTLALFVFSFARIDGMLSPFAIAFLFSVVFMPVNAYYAAAVAFGCSFFVNMNSPAVLGLCFAIGVFLCFSILIRSVPRVKTITAAMIFFVASNGLSIVYAFISGSGFYRNIVTMIAGAIFLFCVIIFIDVARTKRAKIPWTIDQKIAAAAVVVIFALGLAGLDFHQFSVHKFVTIFVILVGIYNYDARNTLVAAMLMGLGYSLIALNLNYVAIYALLTVCTMAFRAKNPTYSIIALMLTDLVLGAYFGAYINFTFWTLLPNVLAIAIFLALPTKIMSRFNFSAYNLNGALVSKNTINKNRAGVYAKLISLTEVFSEMRNIYNGLVHSSLAPSEKKVLMAGQIKEQVCADCPRRNECQKTEKDSQEVQRSLEDMAFVGLGRGTVNFLDLPHAMTVKCARMQSLLSSMNNLLRENQSRERVAATMDMGKVLMSQLFAGLTKMLGKFASDACSGVVFDAERAELIKEELLYRNIVVSDALITKSNINDYNVSVLVTRADSQNKMLERVISQVLKHKMQIDSIDDGDTAGFCIVNVRTAPRYRVVFGVAAVGKNFAETSGDIYSFLKINAERTMMAICDGMGAGERAQRASTIAISLVENFYKAGFPDDMIMGSVNQLLQMTGQEIFSALDICVFNLNSGAVDFIKVGATDGFIKRENEVEIIEAGSLPIGILDEMRPKITSAVVDARDYVVLVSDGVMDAFSNRSGFANFINNITAKSPQELADMIMQETLARSGNIAADDCTITVAQLVDTMSLKKLK